MDDLIRRSDAIRVASGYCHWTNIPKELAKLPSVNPIPCEDAISRQAVMDCFKKWQPYMATRILDFEKELSTLPSASTEKTGRWIPVSERLPEDGIYLVTVERVAGVPRIETKSFAKDLNRVDDYDFPEHKCGWYEYDSEYGYWEDTDVIAWQSLPQPYKAVGEVGESE